MTDDLIQVLLSCGVGGWLRLSSRRFTQLTDAALMLDDGTREVMDVVVLCIAPGTSYMLNVLQYLYITL